MGNQIICGYKHQYRDLNLDKEQMKAHKLLASIQESHHKLNGENSGGRESNEDDVQLFLAVLSNYVTVHSLLYFILSDTTRMQNFLRELSLEHIKQWLILHPKSFDVIMKDLHMESTVKWMQVKHDLMDKLKQGSYYIKTAPLSNGNSQTISSTFSNLPQFTPDFTLMNISGRELPKEAHTPETRRAFKSQQSSLSRRSRPNVVPSTAVSEGSHLFSKISNPSTLLGNVSAYTSKLIDSSLISQDAVIEEMLTQMWTITDADQVVFLRMGTECFDKRIIVSAVQSGSSDLRPTVETQDRQFPFKGIGSTVALLGDWTRTSTHDPAFYPSVDGGCSVVGGCSISAIPLKSPDVHGAILLFHPINSVQQQQLPAQEETNLLTRHLLNIAIKCLELTHRMDHLKQESKTTELLLDTLVHLSKAKSMSQAVASLEQCGQNIIGAEAAKVFHKENICDEPKDMLVLETAEKKKVMMDDSKQRMACPILAGKSLVGVLTFNVGSKIFSNADKNLANSLLNWCNEFLSQKSFISLNIRQKADELLTFGSKYSGSREFFAKFSEWCKQMLNAKKCTVYIHEILLTPDLKRLGELVNLKQLEGNQGLVSWSFASNSAQRDIEGIPRVYHQPSTGLKIPTDNICCPLRTKGQAFGVIECSQKICEEFDNIDLDILEEISMIFSVGIRLILEYEIEQKFSNLQRSIFDALLLESDQKIIDIDSQTITVGSDLSTSKNNQCNICQMVRTANEKLQLGLCIENIPKFVENLLNHLKPTEISHVSDRLQMFIQILERPNELQLFSKTDIVAILVSLLCIHTDYEGSHDIVSSSNNFSTVTSKKSVTQQYLSVQQQQQQQQKHNQVKHSAIQYHKSNLLKFFYKLEADLFANYNDETVGEIFIIIKLLFNTMCKKNAVAKMQRMFDGYFDSFFKRSDKTMTFASFFDPFQDPASKQLLLQLFTICMSMSMFTRQWTVTWRHIQQLLKPNQPESNHSLLSLSLVTSTSHHQVQRLQQYLAFYDYHVLPCWELLKLVFLHLDIADKSIDAIYHQAVDNRKKLAEFTAAEDLSASESIIAIEEVFSSNIVSKTSTSTTCNSK